MAVVRAKTRPTTIETYSSKLRILQKFFATLENPPRLAFQFNRRLLVDFLDWLILQRHVGHRTYNNYRLWLSSITKFMLSRSYITEDPVATIPVMPKTAKKRVAFTAEMLRTLFDHLHGNDPYFLLGCMFQYYTLIRPSEMVHIKIGDISVKNQTVFVPGEVSKNKRDDNVALPTELLRLMIELRVLEAHPSFYLFSKELRPGTTKVDPDIFNKRWKPVRKYLKWSDKYQFYSLKDSGIRDLANTAGIVVARDQARHTDIATTNKYLQGRDGKAPEAAKQFRGPLSFRQDPEERPSDELLPFGSRHRGGQ